MTWPALLALAAAAYALKALGPVALAGNASARLLGLELLAVPLLAALIAVQTFDGGGRLTIDARVPALAVAAVLVVKRAPFLVVVIAAAATAALVRAVT